MSEVEILDVLPKEINVGESNVPDHPIFIEFKFELEVGHKEIGFHLNISEAILMVKGLNDLILEYEPGQPSLLGKDLRIGRNK